MFLFSNCLPFYKEKSLTGIVKSQATGEGILEGVRVPVGRGVPGGPVEKYSSVKWAMASC
jgi:hypothetical protein